MAQVDWKALARRFAEVQERTDPLRAVRRPAWLDTLANRVAAANPQPSRRPGQRGPEFDPYMTAAVFGQPSDVQAPARSGGGSNRLPASFGGFGGSASGGGGSDAARSGKRFSGSGPRPAPGWYVTRVNLGPPVWLPLPNSDDARVYIRSRGWVDENGRPTP